MTTSIIPTPTSQRPDSLCSAAFHHSSRPIYPKYGPHFLNLICLSPDFDNSSTELITCSANKMECFVCVSVNELRDINPSNETYQVNLRLYVVWRPALRGRCETTAKHARAIFAGHAARAKKQHATSLGEKKYVSLTDEERDGFMEAVRVPEIFFPSATTCEATDEPSIRVYANDFILWNQAYTLEHSHTFDLREFPYDSHNLPLNLAQNNSATWDLFDVTIAQVQFQKDALEMSEWKIFTPNVHKDNHKKTTVYLLAKRESTFYSQNVVLVMLGISALG